MSERGYVYHDHPRPFCGEGCPAYGESPLIQRYRKRSAMSEPRTAADHRRFIPDDMKPNDAYILGQRDRYRRDREPDIKCRNCGQPWAIEGEAAFKEAYAALDDIEAEAFMDGVRVTSEVGGSALRLLALLIQNPHGCRFCDYGELRNPTDPARTHDADCLYLQAGDLVGRAYLDAAMRDKADKTKP